MAVGVRGITTTRMSVTVLRAKRPRRAGRGPRRSALAEPHDEEVRPENVHVPALEGVPRAALIGAVEEQSVVGQRRVKLEEGPDQQFLGPSHVVAHRAHHAVPPDHHPDIPRKEEVGERRQRKGVVVERPGQRPRLALRALDDAAHHLHRRQLRQFTGQRIRRYHVERAGDQELARCVILQHVDEEVADLVHLREAAQHAHELAVFPLGHVERDDVVVEEGGAVLRRHRLEFRSRRVHQNCLERDDFGGDVD